MAPTNWVLGLVEEKTVHVVWECVGNTKTVVFRLVPYRPKKGTLQKRHVRMGMQVVWLVKWLQATGSCTVPRLSRGFAGLPGAPDDRMLLLHVMTGNLSNSTTAGCQKVRPYLRFGVAPEQTVLTSWRSFAR